MVWAPMERAPFFLSRRSVGWAAKREDLMAFAVSGVNSAVATPVNADLSPDLGLLAEHAAGCSAMAAMGWRSWGRRGEANSFRRQRAAGDRRGRAEGGDRAGAVAAGDWASRRGRIRWR